MLEYNILKNQTVELHLLPEFKKMTRKKQKAIKRVLEFQQKELLNNLLEK